MIIMLRLMLKKDIKDNFNGKDDEKKKDKKTNFKSLKKRKRIKKKKYYINTKLKKLNHVK
jgi:hypothetical protein